MVACAFIAGCGKKNSDSAEIHQFVAQLKSSVKTEPKKIEVKLQKPPKKLPAKIVSPFPKSVAAVSLDLKRLPLVRYPLTTLHLIGVVHKAKLPFAVVMAPDKKVYSIYVGDYIGREVGKVTAILPNKVVVADTSNTSSGKPTGKTVILRLKGSPDL